MYHTLLRHSESVNQGSLGEIIVLLSPHRRCWQCERPLPLAPLAVVTQRQWPDRRRRTLVMLICSPECAKKPKEEIVHFDGDANVFTSADAHALLFQSRDVVAVMEMQWCGDGLYGQVTEGRRVADRLAELLGRSV